MSAWQNATCDEGRVSGSRWRRGGGRGNVTDVTDLRGRHTKWKAFRSLEKQSSQIYFFSLWQWIICESGHIKCILRVFQGNRESSSSVFWVIFCVEFPNFRVGSIFCRFQLEVGESHLERFNVQCQERALRFLKYSGDKDVLKTVVDLGSSKVAAATAASTTVQPRLVATHVPPGNIIRGPILMQNIIICKI